MQLALSVHTRATSGAAWALLGTTGAHAARLLAFLILARLLGPEVYGLVALAIIATAVGNILVSQGGWLEAIVRGPRTTERELHGLFWLLVGWGVIVGLLVAASGPLMAGFFGEPDLAALVPWLALGIPLAAINVVPRAQLQRELSFRPLAFATVTAISASSLVAVIAALHGGGAWSLVAFQLSEPLVEALALFWFTRFRPRPRLPNRRLLELGRFASWVFVERLFVLLEQVLLRGYVGYAYGPMAVGYYVLARRLAELVIQLTISPIGRVGFAAFSASQADPAELTRSFQLALRMSWFLCAPVCIGVAVVADDMVVVLFGPEWLEGAALVRLLALAGLVMPIHLVFMALFYAQGRSNVQFGLGLIGSLVLFGLVAALPEYGVVMVGVALLMRAVLMAPIRVVLLQRLGAVRPGPALRGSFGVLAASLVMGSVVAAFRYGAGEHLVPEARLLACTLAGVAVYLVTVRWLARPLLLEVAGLWVAARHGPPKSHEQP